MKTGLTENVKTLYSLVLGQHTDVIRARIEALDEQHNNLYRTGNSIGLLQAIRALVYNFQSQKFQNT
jgi:hypothetical protein